MPPAAIVITFRKGREKMMQYRRDGGLHPPKHGLLAGVLMPIVASMGGNAGTQTLAVAVRALAMKDLRARKAVQFITREALVGLFNGMGFALVAFVFSALWFQDVILGTVIAVAMLINLIVAGLSGTMVPIILDRLKIDPANASAVFLTTITDVVGFFVFLGLAAAFLV